jgi:hypothetical protein
VDFIEFQRFEFRWGACVARQLKSVCLDDLVAREGGSAGDPATAMPDPINHAVVLGPIKAKPFG